MQQLLYIGLNGLAGSGKDTVAKALNIMLNYEWDCYEDFREYYDKYYLSNAKQLATFNRTSDKDERLCTCIAFADQLKYICSTIFGIPVDRFYYNKANSWICINKDFHYTEVKPVSDRIVTAEEFFVGINTYLNSPFSYYMSLRELLVYVGTYLCQNFINKNIFLNIVNNTISQKIAKNRDLKYVILTDVRFQHELEYIRKHNGITITITRDGVSQLDNIAEHDLDNQDDYDFEIDNSGTYEELFLQVWNMVHDNIEFQNNVILLDSRDGTDNYIRLIKDDKDSQIYKLCPEYSTQRVSHSGPDIIMIDPVGGPAIFVNSRVDGTNLMVNKIELAINGFLLHTTKH